MRGNRREAPEERERERERLELMPQTTRLILFLIYNIKLKVLIFYYMLHNLFTIMKFIDYDIDFIIMIKLY